VAIQNVRKSEVLKLKNSNSGYYCTFNDIPNFNFCHIIALFIISLPLNNEAFIKILYHKSFALNFIMETCLSNKPFTELHTAPLSVIRKDSYTSKNYSIPLKWKYKT
jgi:hypothetical protein